MVCWVYPPQKRLWAVWVEQIDLSLSLNEIGNAGAAVIAEGLKCNLSLAQLHLEGCGITETGPCAIINAFRDTWQAETQLADVPLLQHHCRFFGMRCRCCAPREEPAVNADDLGLAEARKLTLGSLVQLGRGAHAMTTPQGNRPRIENILSDDMRERQ